MNAIADAAICQALADLLRSRTEWDEAPGLHLLYREAGGVRVSGDSLIPSFAWAGRPPETLWAFAAGLEGAPAGMLAALAPDEFAGVVFRFEGWGVEQHDPGPSERARIEAMQQARQLHLHPGRVEERCAWAVTRDGTNYMAKQARGGEAISHRMEGQITGLIPSSLTRMIRALSAGVN